MQILLTLLVFLICTVVGVSKEFLIKEELKEVPGGGNALDRSIAESRASAKKRMMEEGLGDLGNYEKPIDLTCDTYPESKNGSTWMIMYYSPTCKYCKRMGPIYEKVAYKVHKTLSPYPVIVARISCPENIACCVHEGIEAFPTFRMFRNGYLVDPALDPKLSLTNEQSVHKFIKDAGMSESTDGRLTVTLARRARNFLLLNQIHLDNGMEKPVDGKPVLNFFTADWCRACDEPQQNYDTVFGDRKKWAVPDDTVVQAYNCASVNCSAMPGYHAGLDYPYLSWLSADRSVSLHLPLLQRAPSGATRRQRKPVPLTAEEIRAWIEDPHPVIFGHRGFDEWYSQVVKELFELGLARWLMVLAFGALMGIVLGRRLGLDRPMFPDGLDESDEAAGRKMDPAVEAELRRLDGPNTWSDAVSTYVLFGLVAIALYDPLIFNKFFTAIGLFPSETDL